MCTAWMGEPAPKPEPTATPFETMMASFLPPVDKEGASPAKQPEDRVEDKPPAWEEMMARGRDMQEQYLASLQSIFDEAEKPPGRADLRHATPSGPQSETAGRTRVGAPTFSARDDCSSRRTKCTARCRRKGSARCAHDLAAGQADIAQHPVVELGEIADFPAVTPETGHVAETATATSPAAEAGP